MAPNHPTLFTLTNMPIVPAAADSLTQYIQTHEAQTSPEPDNQARINLGHRFCQSQKPRIP